MSDRSPLAIVICGATGRMGGTVARLAASDPAFTIVGGIDRAGTSPETGTIPRIESAEGADDLIRDADLLIDFSAPALLSALLATRARLGSTSALVVGTTGLGNDETKLLEDDARRAPVLTAANFSLGVNLLVQLAELVSRALGEEYDAEIVEAHHRRKEDAPSGTALALGRAVAAGRGVDLGKVRRDGRTGRPGARPRGEIGLHAVRGGDVVGDHQVMFLGELERIELAHRASDRAVFAAGALHAGRWLAGRDPGLYTMRQVLGL